MENIKDKPTHYFAFVRISSYLENTMKKLQSYLCYVHMWILDLVF
jgi:hypothetical protein